MLKLRSLILIIVITLLPNFPGLAQTGADLFLAKTYRNVRGQTMPYRLFVPKQRPGQKYPLILWLHGAGGRGTDNLKQITGGNTSGAQVWIKAENQAKYPCFVLAPQCPENETWSQADGSLSPQMRLVLELLEQLKQTSSSDAERLYVAGQSMGGYGTWALLAAQPKMFAAAVPLCGGGEESKAALLVSTPIWAFHGEQDQSVNVAGSRKMIAALKRAGGSPRYTEYPGVGHACWLKAFSEPELLPWVFSQRRKFRPTN
jgi:predicted peptidase